MCTAGLYNLMDDGLPRTAARDAYLAILGLVAAAFIDTLFAYSEMRARQDSAYARAAAAATSEFELGTAPIRSTRGEWDLRLGRARAAAETGARHSPREPRRPGLHLDRLRQPLELLAVLRVPTWMIMSGDCFWGCRLGRREWYDQLPAVAIGLLLMLFTGTLLMFGFAVDRLDPDAFPHVRAWLEPPSGAPSMASLARTGVPALRRRDGRVLRAPLRVLVPRRRGLRRRRRRAGLGRAERGLRRSRPGGALLDGVLLERYYVIESWVSCFRSAY